MIRDKRTNKSKGFGFVSFKDPGDFIKAMKEMDGKNDSFSFIFICLYCLILDKRSLKFCKMSKYNTTDTISKYHTYSISVI